MPIPDINYLLNKYFTVFELYDQLYTVYKLCNNRSKKTTITALCNKIKKIEKQIIELESQLGLRGYSAVPGPPAAPSSPT